jgi:uncharacterized protein
MRVISGTLRLSASDLSNHLSCRYLTSIDLGVSKGLHRASTWHSPDAWVLQQRGLAHENTYIEHLKIQGVSIVDLRDVTNEEEASARTLEAMQKGSEVIIQGVLSEGRWFGRADVLRRVHHPSSLGPWSYEVYDCKLALITKAATILQLSFYSDLLGIIQGQAPSLMHVVPPSDNFIVESHRFLDYAAYYRHVKRRLEIAVEHPNGNVPDYPEPREHCPICRWWWECDAQRRKDDHLSLVAGISSLQRKQLTIWNLQTVTDLAVLPIPLQQSPDRASKESYINVREQARVQIEGRTTGKPVHEILTIDQEHGFSRLPEPSIGDVFFDLEADPFVGRGGREYLFGCVYDAGGDVPIYERRWAMTTEEERQAFEWFVDLVIERWAKYPAMHVFHFTGYEPGALKRLMGRHATREDEIDRMLRAGLLVDLHTVLKRSARASVEQYSLKALEVFHGFERKIPLEDARTSMRELQHWLELESTVQLDEKVRDAVALYNADDCLSTRSLRDWLEREREAKVKSGVNIPRPTSLVGAAPDKVTERQQRAAALAVSLRDGIPAEVETRTEEQKARWLMADLLDWHRREAKADWWEFYRLRDLSDEDLLNERSALSSLKFVERLAILRNIPIDRYTYEKQETDVRSGKELCSKGENLGEVIEIDQIARRIDIKKTKKTADIHPNAVYMKDIGPGTDVLADSLYRIGSWISSNGMDAQGPYQAARDMLLRRPPRLHKEAPLAISGEPTLEAAKRVGCLLDRSVLAIQGPPGAGKTYTGARMICELVRQGKKVGITATTHKVIGNLLSMVVECANETGLNHLKCVRKTNKEEKPKEDPPHIKSTVENKETRAAFLDGAHVLAGTQWLWAQEDYHEAVDVLFVDEAGQMALANVLAVSHCAKSVVLLGDPQQLDQPLRGSHPEGADLSGLEHLLAGERTIATHKGLFLGKTWRLHPALCLFTSEAFYDGRLNSRDGLENQTIEGHPWLHKSGLLFVPVTHEGNQNTSPEEVEAVVKLVDSFMTSKVSWVNDLGDKRPILLSDILVVAPYNAQVAELRAKIPNGRIGTVDKFQGQQAPVVVYSLTTSSPEDAPRGMEFIYSLNRLNVATSRAQAVVIVVASPRLLEPECRSPRQMQLANALCRYVELARIMDVK